MNVAEAGAVLSAELAAGGRRRLAALEVMAVLIQVDRDRQVRLMDGWKPQDAQLEYVEWMTGWVQGVLNEAA